MTIKPQLREPKLCSECGYLLRFRADSAGRLVAYCEGCEVEIPIESVPRNAQPPSLRNFPWHFIE